MGARRAGYPSKSWLRAGALVMGRGAALCQMARFARLVGNSDGVPEHCRTNPFTLMLPLQWRWVGSGAREQVTHAGIVVDEPLGRTAAARRSYATPRLPKWLRVRSRPMGHSARAATLRGERPVAVRHAS